MFHAPKNRMRAKSDVSRTKKASHAPKKTSHVPKKKRIHTISHFVVETPITFRESKIRDATGVVANLESGSQRDSNHPATRSYHGGKNPSPNWETLQDSD